MMADSYRQLVFLSTLSLRRATVVSRASCRGQTISIHALLAESDSSSSVRLSRRSNFYPRSPCGERLLLDRFKASGGFYFYPRSPCGERHSTGGHPFRSLRDFYPRSPCGERPDMRKFVGMMSNFYPRSPCGERQTKTLSLI